MNTVTAARSLTASCKIWVLAPHIETADPNIQYYYDFSQSIAEYSRVFAEWEVEWEWQAVTLDNFQQVIRSIDESSTERKPLIINLCDGDEVNGAPGVSVIRELDARGLIYTGSDTHFYEITTSKIPMKRAFDLAGVSHAPWELIREEENALTGLTGRIGTPLIIKPAVSGGSMGVSVKNVVHTEEELRQRVKEMQAGYRGWNLLADGIFAEKFINGPEYTTFITGSANQPAFCKVYEPVKRVFHHSLPDTEQFLSFDRLWEIYEEESPMPDQAHFYEYAAAEPELVEALKQLSLEAFSACGGKGYTRIDIRQDRATGTFYVLEANAQCGLSEDENYTSIGAILRQSGVGFGQVVLDILEDAVRRHSIPAGMKFQKIPA